jgi:inosose dehydratase
MSSLISRRRFIGNVGACAAVSSASFRSLSEILEPPLYPPMDLSYFDKPITPAPFEIRFGYAAIAWKGKDRQAITEISEAGYRGIQLRANVLTEFGERPTALRDLLQQHRLELVALSSGDVPIAPGTGPERIAYHTHNAQFVRDVGGSYLQLIDSARPAGRKPVAEDYKILATLLSEIGKRAADIGVSVGYHNHMDSLGDSPENVDRVMNEVDPHYVKLLLDTAHYQQAGGDPAKAIRQYRDHILFLHLKDVASSTRSGSADAGQSYRFVELGSGRVDLRAVFAALKEIKFRGWGVVELDGVSDNPRPPKESAIISKKYLEEKLGMKV